MKIWVDDIRTPPDGWYWFKTSAETIDFLYRAYFGGSEGLPVEVMSLDHDLGFVRGKCTCGEVNKENVLGHADGCRYFADSKYDTTRPIVLWMCENDIWPVEVRIHSANPVGIDWLEGMIERYKT